LFGRQVSRDVFTEEQAKHATTVVPANELFIEFGNIKTHLGEHLLPIPLPPKVNHGAMMAISYYVIGKIQAQKPPYFKNNIVKYCRKASELFGEDIKPIVE
jgi:hypothetical protein